MTPVGGVSRCLVLGAGAHAKVLIEAMRAAGLGEVVGVVDPAPPVARILDVPVIGRDEDLPRLRSEGITTAVVMARAVVGTDTSVGLLAIVNTGAVIDHDGVIDEAAHVAPGCALAGNVLVGARALVGVGSAVRPGIRIGADAVVGAGSAVVADVEAGATVGGAPSRALKRSARL